MGRPLPPNHDHKVPLAKAAADARRFREHGKQPNRDCGAFTSAAVLSLLAQPGCTGIRYYQGTREGGEAAMILVGVDGDGNDMTEGVILDTHLPCPPWCSDPDELNS